MSDKLRKHSYINDFEVNSYRVRECDEENYIVEKYTVNLLKEIESLHNNTVNYDVKFFFKKTNKNYFEKYFIKINQKHQYQLNNTDNTEELNRFLSTHYYFKRGYDLNSSNEEFPLLQKLNSIAEYWISDYNNRIIEEQYQYPELDKNNFLISKLNSQKEKINKIEFINVGQANCSFGYSNDKPLAVFDIGAKTSYRYNLKYVSNMLKKLDNCGFVLISHYDADHINGIKHLNEEVFDRVWILPTKRTNPTPTERNLFSKLKVENCFFLPDIDYSVDPFNSTNHVLNVWNIDIFRGNCKKRDEYQSTDENARCLISYIKNEKSVLLPADSLYKEFPKTFEPDYFVMPHHCCKYNDKPERINLSKTDSLIVFAGPNKRYMHPNLSHLNMFLGKCSIEYLMNHDGFIFENNTIKIGPKLHNNRKSFIINI